MTFIRSYMKNAWFQASVLCILFIAAYWIPIVTMVNTWLKNDDYSYGFFIPLVSLYFIWDKRSQLKGVDIKSSWAVFPVLLFMVLLSLYGILGSSGNISMPALPLLIICFVTFCFGIKISRFLILPLGFLVFMVPMPALIERTLGIYLKSISSRLGGEFIHLFNIPVNVSGNVIDLGITQLQVVDACNGLRYIIPLMALGVIYAYFFERVTWKRIFCVLATLPIAILTNALRIGITGILTRRFGPGVAEGFFHAFSGWALFMAASVFIFLVGRILRFFPPKKGRSRGPAIPLLHSDIPHATRSSDTKGAFVTSIVILIMVAGLSLSTKALPAIKITGGIEGFPLTFSDWSGEASLVSPEIIEASGAEEAFSGNYHNAKGYGVSLYIGYRGTAFLANDNFFHSPTVCLPSSGWENIDTSTRIINNVPFCGQLKVTRMIISNLDEKAVVYFWFQTKNKSSHDKNINRFDLALHAIRRDNTHDLFIRTITTIHQGETIEDGEQKMDVFVRDMTKALQHYIKEKQIIAP